MMKRLASGALMAALVCAVGGRLVFANTPTNTDTTAKAVLILPASPASAKKELPANEKLRTDLAKLMADAKAGKEKLPAPPQFHPAARNNLSKGTKIALGVGIAAVVVLAIIVVHAKNHLFDNFNLSNNR
jgi:hypothetical protein